MDTNIFNGILRAILPAVTAYAVGKGWFPTESVGDITAAVTAVGAAFWSVLSNRK